MHNQARDLGEREDQNQVKEELERRDLLLVAQSGLVLHVGRARTVDEPPNNRGRDSVT